jgi:muramoyltetrapeptide carboxypeptidase LdcA involved in peptidoglycan recycling
VLVQENFEKYETYSINREDGKELEPFNLTEEVIYKNLYGNNKEEFEGRLIGGCIDVLKVIIGTEFDNTNKFCKQFDEGMIWYLENCEMSVCELYRSLWQMKNAGWFENANAFLIGRTRANNAIGEFSYEDVLHKVFDDMNVKVIYDVDFGHVQPQWAMVNGSYAKFEYKDGKGKMETYLK